MSSAAAAHSIELAPHCSLTTAHARGFFVVTCVLAFTIGGGFAIAGFWPVLPFAGIEMAVLGIALRLSMQRRRQGHTQHRDQGLPQRGRVPPALGTG